MSCPWEFVASLFMETLKTQLVAFVGSLLSVPPPVACDAL